ncbi:HesA/MoeB/ThiF family protein [Lentibacter algarum]|uniref:HesA/MoeB/ThiF family protein n=1 Tax=Lentibacter algarum TaxID=576131 RepID=UPI001C09C81B|nr:HesA/MoeB/ThiF family protein [Lentibacter algarum]MBU2983493.1 HesA/MoeB/ThiF family protein [Lentibacter algarum]
MFGVTFVGTLAILWALNRYLRWQRALACVLFALALFALLGFGLWHLEYGVQLWTVAGGLASLVAGYVLGLKVLKARARPQVTQTPKPLFNDTELERYARHIVLRELGGAGQKKLKQSKVLVVGAGGLGSPVLMYLTAAGVGTIGVIDDDTVEHTNLQRQIIHRDENTGQSKVQSAAAAMRALNPFVEVRPYARRLTGENVGELLGDYDVIIDGTDNFSTRYLVNRSAVALGKPLVSGALAQWEGQLSVFDPARGGPCYECIFPKAPADGLAPSCAEAGVVGPLPGVIGSMMALEAVKLITGAGQVTRGEMLIYDGLYGESRKIKLARRDDCAACKNL